MKVKNRQVSIINYIKHNKKASVDELVENFNTTGTTIRKDLAQLANDKLIIRTYGGAILNQENHEDHPIDYKTNINLIKKIAIAKKAVEFISEGDFVLFDAGSTVVQMTPLLSKFDFLTIMTNSLSITNELVSLNKNHTVILSGGVFRKKSASFHNSGQISAEEFKQYQFDYLFIGADGIDNSGKVTTFNDSYHGSIEMMKATKKIILLVDSSKFGRRGPNVLFNINKVDIVITDELLDDVYIKFLNKTKVKLIQVPVATD